MSTVLCRGVIIFEKVDFLDLDLEKVDFKSPIIHSILAPPPDSLLCASPSKFQIRYFHSARKYWLSSPKNWVCKMACVSSTGKLNESIPVEKRNWLPCNRFSSWNILSRAFVLHYNRLLMLHFPTSFCIAGRYFLKFLSSENSKSCNSENSCIGSSLNSSSPCVDLWTTAFLYAFAETVEM